MRRSIAVVVALSCLSCANPLGGGFRLRQPSCEADFAEWNPDLLYYVLEGEGDGSFDIDPPGDVETRVAGAYDPDGGAFSWTLRFDPLHWRVGVTATGSGTVEENGDVDLSWVEVTESVTGETSETEKRLVRAGCDETGRTTYDGGDVSEWEGTYTDGQFAFTGSDTFEGGSSEFAGVNHSDRSGTQTMTITYDTGTTSERTISWDDGAGTYEYVFVTTFDGGVREGEARQDSAGTWRVDWTTDFGGGVVYEVTYDLDVYGNGEGTKHGVDDEGNAYTCALSWEDGACTQDCPVGYNDGECNL